jgi:DUF4097 and DUF4098 domain-containing protein YvlB
MRHERFDTPGKLRLDLSVPAGEIDVRAEEGAAETTVDLEPLRSNDVSREAVESARIELRDRGGDAQELVVDARGPRALGLFTRGPAARLVVHCPAGADLEAEGGSTDVQAAGRYGSVEVQTGSGNVAVAEADGEAKLKSGSGDIAVERVGGELSAQTGSGDVAVGRTGGPAAVRSASGDVTVRDAAWELTVQTASGDISVEAVSAGEVSIQSASGEVSVGVRKGRTLWVDAKSMSGETTSDFPVGESPGEEQEEGPLVELRIQTMSGDIHIGRAAERVDLPR